MSLFKLIPLAYTLICLWFVCWCWWTLRGVKLRRRLLTTLVMGLLAIAMPFVYFNSRSGGPLLILQISGFWMAGFAIVAIITVVITIADAAYHTAVKRWLPLKVRVLLFVSAFVIPTVVTGLGMINAKHPTIVEYHITTHPDRPIIGGELTVALLSDLHLGRQLGVDFYEKVLALASSANPDIILFAGDIIDDYQMDIPALRTVTERYPAPLGTWGVLGNHEYYSGSAPESIAVIEGMGITMVHDRWESIAGRFILAGRDDLTANRRGPKRALLEDILATIPPESAALPVILMDHQPHFLYQAEATGVFLQLSGHTHNGQIWPYNFIVKMLYENPHGHSRRGDTHYIVSLGAGTWGIATRSTGRPEVVIIKITNPV